jgi:hypothetical protein
MKTKIKKTICSILAFAIFFAGCAGRKANPIPFYIPGDENRSCAALKAELTQLQEDMTHLLPKTNKFGTNALWASAGVLLIVPFFFMDLKDAEKTEFEAMRKRHNHLLTYTAEKNCDMSGIRAERIPSLEEQKEKAKEAKETLKNQKKTNGTQ